jgi:hypothetical protein
MALDTALKRGSAIHHGSPWRGILPLPDGGVDQADRQVVSFLYSGIVATGGTPAADGSEYLIFTRRHMRR